MRTIMMVAACTILIVASAPTSSVAMPLDSALEARSVVRPIAGCLFVDTVDRELIGDFEQHAFDHEKATRETNPGIRKIGEVTAPVTVLIPMPTFPLRENDDGNLAVGYPGIGPGDGPLGWAGGYYWVPLDPAPNGCFALAVLP